MLPCLNFSHDNLLLPIDKVIDNWFMYKSKWHVTANGIIRQNWYTLLYIQMNQKTIKCGEKNLEEAQHWLQVP